MSIELPNELQREIFELAARSSISTAIELQVIGKKVSEWVIPLVYEIVVIKEYSTPPFYYPPGINSNIEQIFKNYGKYIRSFSTDNLSVQNTKLYIEHASNISNFALRNSGLSTDLFNFVEQLPLRRLSCNLTSCQMMINPSSPAFRELTHLDLICSGKWSAWAILADFPKLTHLAVDDCEGTDHIPLPALQHCKLLQVVILVFDMEVSRREETKEAVQWRPGKLEAEDPRIVAVFIDPLRQWLEGAQGMSDVWTFAENVILERRQK